jgi:hypothetical protein
MKNIFFFVICLFFLPLIGEVSLNDFGNIDYAKEEFDIECSYEENEYYIYVDDFKLIGNSLFSLPINYLTLVTEHENFPTWLRIYEKFGNEKFLRILPKTINITFSENKKYAAFSTGGNTNVLDLETFDISEHPNSVVFSVNNESQLAYIADNAVHFARFSIRLEEIPQKILFVKNTPILFIFLQQFSIHEEKHFLNNGISADDELPKQDVFLTNYANPFNPSTTFIFSTEQYELIIYNLKGQKIKTFSNLQIIQSPNQQIVWNGTNDYNKPVSSGIYFLQIKNKVI